MKRFTFLAVLALGPIAILGLGPLSAARARASVSSPLDQLLPLVGEWEGTNGSGASVKLTYTLVSNGSALMERMQPSNEPEMITMYTVEGDHLRVTHYCSAGNQPEMESAAISGRTHKFTFSLTSVKGLKTPDEGYMTNLVLTMVDKDHLTQEWTFLEKGKKSTEVFKYARKS